MTRLLFILLLVAGSVTAQLPPMPPAVKTFKDASITQGAGAKSLITPKAVVVPKTLMLTWNHPDSDVTFNVYHAYTPSLSAMTLLGSTAEKRYVIAPSRPAEFFGVKAVRNGMESDWGTR